ncbi:pilus assembly FimT family protein [Geothrix edaphica]|uniref:pilus assembly FimT family protein n=1 Tax=Geothrix edaphica TaxID=2927976 RepID=UPI002556146B|nr:prepilin-type N-terminal cleavage/methylation domain-containing protein [Geothrix edaphica]
MPHDTSPSRGYTLIELLVVLVIIAVLAVVGASTLQPKSPRATQNGLTEIRGVFIHARNLAMSSGRTVVITGDWSTGPLQFRQMADDLTLITPPMGQMAFESTWQRYAQMKTTADGTGLVTGEISKPTLVAGITTVFKSAGWSSPVQSANGSYGFSPSGVPLLLANGGAGTTLTTLTNGAWLGVVGKTPKDSGPPYGVVIITPQGNVLAFYKPDSKLDTPAENQWRRLD